MARKLLRPTLKNALASSAFSGRMLHGSGIEMPGPEDYVTAVQAVIRKAKAGDLSMVSEMLAAQAITLDSMFAETARRGALNMGDYPDAAASYMRLAISAQTNCRTTLEALAKLHSPREQVVKHVHVNGGGQAIVAEQFHHYNKGGERAENDGQSYATRNSGECSALPCQDAQGVVVPISGGEGKETVPDARRD